MSAWRMGFPSLGFLSRGGASEEEVQEGKTRRGRRGIALFPTTGRS